VVAPDVKLETDVKGTPGPAKKYAGMQWAATAAAPCQKTVFETCRARHIRYSRYVSRQFSRCKTSEVLRTFLTDVQQIIRDAQQNAYRSVNKARLQAY